MRSGFIKEHFGALVLAVLLHAAIIVALVGGFIKFSEEPTPQPAPQLAIEGTVVDEKQIVEEMQRQESEEKQAQERAEQLKREREDEEQRLADLKRQREEQEEVERLRVEKQKLDEAERQRV